MQVTETKWLATTTLKGDRLPLQYCISSRETVDCDVTPEQSRAPDSQPTVFMQKKKGGVSV